MKARWNYVTALAALLALGDVTSAPSMIREARWLSSGYFAAFSGREIPTREYRVSLKAHSVDRTLAWAQQPPVLPNGARGVMGNPISETGPDLLGVPVVTQSPFPRRRIDPEKLERTTGQLEHLLKAVQPEMTEVSKGRLPKDLIPHLKRIEKLSKQLRREIAP